MRLKFAFVFYLCFLISCEPDNSALTKPKIILEGEISPNYVNIRLGRTINLTVDDFYEPIPDAKVRLFENDREVSDLDFHTLGSSYLSGYSSYYKSLPGYTYRIEAEIEGYPLVYAETIMPSTPIFEFDGIYPSNDSYNSIMVFRVVINDPPSEENFYRLSGLGNFGFSGPGMQPDPVFDVYKSQFDKIASRQSPFFSDREISGQRYVIDYYIYYLPENDEEKVDVEFIFGHLNYDSYWYERTKYLQEQQHGDMFSEPVPLYSNVINAEGCFSAFNYIDTTFLCKRLNNGQWIIEQ